MLDGFGEPGIGGCSGGGSGGESIRVQELREQILQLRQVGYAKDKQIRRLENSRVVAPPHRSHSYSVVVNTKKNIQMNKNWKASLHKSLRSFLADITDDGDLGMYVRIVRYRVVVVTKPR